MQHEGAGMASKNEICEWFERGVSDGQRYMIVVCDTFDWSDYPVYATAETFAEQFWKHSNVNMQMVMEVYDLSRDRTKQLIARRSFSFPDGFDPLNRPATTTTSDKR
jgi:hypothetical protein